MDELLKASALAEASGRPEANTGASTPLDPNMSGKSSEMISVGELGDVTSPSGSDPNVSAPADSGASASLSADAKSKEYKPSPIGKIKRAFAAIVSPPSDKKKGQGAEGPQFKKRTNSESSQNH